MKKTLLTIAAVATISTSAQALDLSKDYTHLGSYQSTFEPTRDDYMCLVSIKVVSEIPKSTVSAEPGSGKSFTWYNELLAKYSGKWSQDRYNITYDNFKDQGLLMLDWAYKFCN